MSPILVLNSNLAHQEIMQAGYTPENGRISVGVQAGFVKQRFYLLVQQRGLLAQLRLARGTPLPSPGGHRSLAAQYTLVQHYPLYPAQLPTVPQQQMRQINVLRV